MCILPQVRCHCPPIWPPALPLNLTYIWLVPCKLWLRNPSLFKLHTFHIPNLISTFLRLGRLSEESVQVPGSVWFFITSLFLRWRVVSPTPILPPCRRSSACSLSSAAYLIYFQLPSTAGGSSFTLNPRTRRAVGTGTHPLNMCYCSHLQPKDAPCCGVRDPPSQHVLLLPSATQGRAVLWGQGPTLPTCAVAPILKKGLSLFERQVSL
jgi:hypothetical protein